MSKSKLRTCLNIVLMIGCCLLQVNCSRFNTDRVSVDTTLHPDWVDQSWITSQPCAAPCWHGLETGKSLRAEALETARKLSFLGNEKELEPPYKGRVTFLCKYPPDEVCVSMRFEHGVLSELSLHLNYSITLEQVVSKIGNPDSFYYSRRQADTKGCALTVLWIQRRIGLGFGDGSIVKGDDLCDLIYKKDGKLPGDIEVHDVDFLSIVRLEENVLIVQKPNTGYTYMLWKGLFSE